MTLFDFIIIFLWWQVVACVGISAGLHRYYAHRQFNVPEYMEYVFLFLGMLAGMRSPIGWIGVHRMHHHHSDTELDPHSPKYKGLMAVLFNQWKLKSIPIAYVRDLMEDKPLNFFHKNWEVLWALTACFALLIHWKVFVIFVAFPAILGFIGFGWVNGFCHDTHGGSKNVMWVNILVGGEGYHDEHHKDGKKIRMGKWDITGYFIEKMI